MLCGVRVLSTKMLFKILNMVLAIQFANQYPKPLGPSVFLEFRIFQVGIEYPGECAIYSPAPRRRAASADKHVSPKPSVWVFTLSRLSEEYEEPHINLAHLLPKLPKLLVVGTFWTSVLWMQDGGPQYDVFQTYLTSEPSFLGASSRTSVSWPLEGT